MAELLNHLSEEMKMEMKRKLLGAVALFAMFSAFEANAQETRNLNVTAEVQESCVITSPATIDMLFGVLDPNAAGPHVVTADLDFNCSQGTTVDIELDLGGGAGTSLTTRVMTSPTGNTLGYRLQTLGTADWGTIAQTASVSMVASGWATTDTATIEGVITQAQVQAAAVDTYSDLVTITLTL